MQPVRPTAAMLQNKIKIMKKLLTVLALTTAFALVANAAEGDARIEGATGKKNSTLGAENKAIRKGLIEKYDANKNGRLDKEERSKMTPEDLEKWNTVSSAAKAKGVEGEKKVEKKQ